MNIRIYQVNMSRDVNNVGFASYENLEKWQGTSAIDSSIYDKVFSGEVKCKTLEDVYVKFNQHHPRGYKARSLSKSDIVEIIGKDGTSEFHYCDSFGFKKVDFEPEKAKLSERYLDLSKGEKIKVLFVPVGKYPQEMEIPNTYEAMTELVGGGTEEYMPFANDNAALVCYRHSKTNGLPMNRAVYVEPKLTEMDYYDLKREFSKAEDNGKHLVGHIVFTVDTFNEPLSEFERTYAISSDNKAFQSGMGGYSIYGRSLDGADPCLRMEGLMAAERGGKDGWKIEKCYLVEDSKQISDIIHGDFFIANANVEAEKYESLSHEQLVKFRNLFKYPERFTETEHGYTAEKYTPQRAGKER